MKIDWPKFMVHEICFHGFENFSWSMKIDRPKFMVHEICFPGFGNFSWSMKIDRPEIDDRENLFSWLFKRLVAHEN